MAPDSKHRKDPTDPHLKFLTRSRRLIHVTRDHMNSVSRISAEIHELSQSILAEHEESVRARQNVQVDVDPGEVVDENVQREISFLINDEPTGSEGHDTIKHQRADESKLPVRCPHIPNLNIHKQRDKSGKPARQRHVTKLPVFPKGNASAIRIYAPGHFTYLVHKQSPRVKQEPPDSHRVKPPRPELQRQNKPEKRTIRFPVLTNRTDQREQSAVRKIPVESKQFPVVKYSLPVYKAPVHIMQPPGYAPRIETMLPRLEKKEPEVTKPRGNTSVRENSAAVRDTLPDISTHHSAHRGRVKTGTIRRTKPSVRPPTRQLSVHHSNRLEFVLDTVKPTGRTIARQTSEPQSIKHERSIDGRTLNELIVTKSLKHEAYIHSRTDNEDERRKTLKRKETVILPKVNPCPTVSPDYRAQHYHRPSYLITSPLPTSHLVPTASIESGLSLSPMPNIHKMTLTPRQTVLISGTPTNFMTSSRPGSIIRGTPVQGTVPRLPKLVTTGEGSKY